MNLFCATLVFASAKTHICIEFVDYFLYVNKSNEFDWLSHNRLLFIITKIEMMYVIFVCMLYIIKMYICVFVYAHLLSPNIEFILSDRFHYAKVEKIEI